MDDDRTSATHAGLTSPQKDIEGGIEQLTVGHDDGLMYFLYQETEDSMLSLMLVGGTDFY